MKQRRRCIFRREHGFMWRHDKSKKDFSRRWTTMESASASLNIITIYYWPWSSCQADCTLKNRHSLLGNQVSLSLCSGWLLLRQEIPFVVWCSCSQIKLNSHYTGNQGNVCTHVLTEDKALKRCERNFCLCSNTWFMFVLMFTLGSRRFIGKYRFHSKLIKRIIEIVIIRFNGQI